MEKEIFKDVKGYEGLYQVSNLGRVKSLSKKTNVNSNGAKYTSKEKILKNSLNRLGYLSVTLCNNAKRKTMLVHRLIAIHFINNKENKPFINHINGIKNDNRIENLEWCTQKENVNHAIKNGLIDIEKQKKITSKVRSKPMLNTDNGIFFNSLKDAAFSLGIHSVTLIDRLKGKSKIKTNLIYV